jgi:hypothetical protein
VTWEWQAWRSFGDIRETFEEKGWKCGFNGRNEDGVMPLLAEAGDRYCISFFKRDPGTRESWFELRDKVRRRYGVCAVHTHHTGAGARGGATRQPRWPVIQDNRSRRSLDVRPAGGARSNGGRSRTTART